MVEFLGWSLCLVLLFACFAESGNRLTWMSILTFFSLFFSRQLGVLLFILLPLVLVTTVCLCTKCSQVNRFVVTSVAGGLMVCFVLAGSMFAPGFREFLVRGYLYLSFPEHRVWLLCVLLATGFFAAYNDGGIAFAVCSVICLMLWLPLYSTPALICWLVLTSAGVCCAANKSRTRWYVVTASTLLLVIGGIWFSSLVTKWETRLADPEIVSLQVKYPVETLETRLAYEQPYRVKPAPVEIKRSSVADRNSQPKTLTESTELELSMRESGSPRAYSLSALMKVHEGEVNHFVVQDGFGIGRRSAPKLPRREEIVLPEIKPIPLPVKPGISSAENSEEDWDPDPAAKRKYPWQPASRKLGEMHIESLLDFAAPERFGYVKTLRQTIGEEPHTFTRLPTIPQQQSQSQSHSWAVTRVDLVSLLKYDTPRVYLSENLPRMEELANAPTRDVNRFEAAALKKLAAGEDLVVAHRVNEIRMVGSIRSMQQCMKCHQVKHGTLLGAFSYQLRRVPAVRKKPPKHDPRVSLLVPVESGGLN